MKNVVECPREFFAYFNALETYSVFAYTDSSTTKNMDVHFAYYFPNLAPHSLNSRIGK